MRRFRAVRMFTVTAASIRRVREAYGMTVAEFAQFVGVSTSTIVAWEDGSARPSNALEQRALDQVSDEAEAQFPGLKIRLEANPDLADLPPGANP